MTTIDTFEDFIRIMDENPEWLEAARSRLLTRELLELPQVVAQLAASHQQFVDSANARFDRLEATQERHEITMARIAETQERHEITMARIAETQERMRETQERHESTMARIAETQERMQESQARMQETQERHEITMARITETQARHEITMARVAKTQERMLETQARMQESQERHEITMARITETQARHEITMARVDETQARHEITMARVDETQARVQETQERHEIIIARIDETQARMQESQARMQESQARMQESQARMQESQARMQESQARMQETQERHETTIARIDETQSIMQRDLDFMKGDHMEMRLQGRIHGLLAERLEMRRIQVSRALYPAGDQTGFMRGVEDAFDEDKITSEQYKRLMRTDLIARARRTKSSPWTYVSVEVSNQLDRGDVDRAVDSASALALVYPEAESLPAVYGSEMSDEDRLYAGARGVEVFLIRSQR